MQKQTVYRGNLKGNALKHYKWKGRRKSKNVIRSTRSKPIPEIITYDSQDPGSQYERERRWYQEEQNLKTFDENLEKRLKENARKTLEAKRKLEAIKKKGTSNGKTVQVKAFTRKLANGKTINIRSFLRRIFK